jgi:hypothetical protein
VVGSSGWQGGGGGAGGYVELWMASTTWSTYTTITVTIGAGGIITSIDYPQNSLTARPGGDGLCIIEARF